MSKRLAIQFYGHLRTFRHTFRSFQKYVVDANAGCGYEIDIFIHTWDVLEASREGAGTHHNENKRITGKPVSNSDREFVTINYKPKSFAVEQANKYKKMMLESMDSVIKMRRDYEERNNIKYDWIINTRPDIFFKTPFVIDSFIVGYTCPPAEYTYYDISLPTQVIFSGGSGFHRFNTADPRWIWEMDLLYFCSAAVYDICTSDPFDIFDVVAGGVIAIRIDYLLHKDYLMYRSDFITWKINDWRRKNKRINRFITGIIKPLLRRFFKK